jgi:hypothetical protein
VNTHNIELFSGWNGSSRLWLCCALLFKEIGNNNKQMKKFATEATNESSGGEVELCMYKNSYMIVRAREMRGGVQNGGGGEDGKCNEIQDLYSFIEACT